MAYAPGITYVFHFSRLRGRDPRPFRLTRETHVQIETENLLITHPKVADAAVFGVPNEDLGEEVKAVVQPLDGVEGDDALAEELLVFCREHLSRQKVPRSIDFEAELPRLPTGKLYKRKLRDAYWGDGESRILG